MSMSTKRRSDFYKSSDYLRFSIRKGPFYALKARSTSLGTIGGIETNAKMEALKVNKQPIKGATLLVMMQVVCMTLLIQHWKVLVVRLPGIRDVWWKICHQYLGK